MNKIEKDVINYIKNSINYSQRELSKNFNISLGKTNQIINKLKIENKINEKGKLTRISKDYLDALRPKRAIILAAGEGFRMIPLNKKVNKAFLVAKEDTLIERLIKQLIEAEIYDISIVAGYKKEDFDYLIDKYDINLYVNENYSSTNSLYSLHKAHDKLENCYIMPCDIFFYDNPFIKERPYSWFMMKDSKDGSLLPKRKTVSSTWFMEHTAQEVGLAYLTYEELNDFREALEYCYYDSKHMNAFWEEVIHVSKKKFFEPVIVNEHYFVECNDCNDLIRLDQTSPSLDAEVFGIIKNVFNVKTNEIKHITCTKAGMTNNSFLFEIHNQRYIMRIPGEGTEFLIDRKQEYDVYQTIKKYNLSDKLYYFDEINGYKITAFIEDTHNCDLDNKEEVKLAMHYLRNFHDLKLTVNHEFNIFDKIEYYESLWNGKSSVYQDYRLTKEHIFDLKNIVDRLKAPYVLTHIDAVADNFIFHKEEGDFKINLIDWEYAAMQDPHLDIAMFIVYALYDKEEIDELLKMYFYKEESNKYKAKIYCYIAIAGLLWSNWCEYKSHLGVEFGEYSLKQYRYAKDYYKIAMMELSKMEKI